MKGPGFLRRYRFALASLAALGLLAAAFPALAPKAGSSLLQQAATVLLVVPPVFLLLGLLDVWIPRETLMRYMGDASGVRGALLAFVLGSAAAGPLYGAFPVATVLMRKGASFVNVLIFVGAWSTTKIPMLVFEASALGWRFALARLAVDLPGIVLIALAIKAVVPKAEAARIYAAAEGSSGDQGALKAGAGPGSSGAERGL